MTMDRIAAERAAQLEARRRRADTPAAKRLAEEIWPDRVWPLRGGLRVRVELPRPQRSEPEPGSAAPG